MPVRVVVWKYAAARKESKNPSGDHRRAGFVTPARQQLGAGLSPADLQEPEGEIGV